MLRLRNYATFPPLQGEGQGGDGLAFEHNPIPLPCAPSPLRLLSPLKGEEYQACCSRAYVREFMCNDTSVPAIANSVIIDNVMLNNQLVG